MKPMVIFSKVGDLFKYLKTWRRRRLYNEWLERGELPPEAVPREELDEDIIPKIDKGKLHLPILYIILGASLVILCLGIALFIVRSC